MALKILTAKHKKGEYQGRSYDNVLLFAVDESSMNEQLFFGPDVEQMKIKYAAFCDIVSRLSQAHDYVKNVRDLEGLFIIPVYDKFGNVTDFSVSDGKTDGAPKKA